jgi:hypothetical protein
VSRFIVLAREKREFNAGWGRNDGEEPKKNDHEENLEYPIVNSKSRNGKGKKKLRNPITDE